MYVSDQLPEGGRTVQTWRSIIKKALLPGNNKSELKYVSFAALFGEIFLIWSTLYEGILTSILLRIISLHDVYMAFMAMTSKPGKLQKLPSCKVEEGTEVVPSINYETADGIIKVSWCRTCNCYKPPYCHHCSVCNDCVIEFDHHCPWLNNCICSRNFHYFFWFLFDTGFGGLLLFGCEIKYSWDMCKSIDGLSLLYNHINWFDQLLCGISFIFVLLMSTRSYYKQMLYTIIIASCAVLFTIHQYFVSPKLALVILFAAFSFVALGFGIWLVVFLFHYVWLFKMDMTQKEYYKGEHPQSNRRKISTMKAVKRLISIMFTKPGSPVPDPVPPFSPFCYLPPGKYVP